jgi:Uma2 family endonuclease
MFGGKRDASLPVPNRQRTYDVPGGDMATELTPRRFTVDEYHRMVEAGILSEDERIELIHGEILRMSPIGGRHVEIVGKLTHLLVQAAGTAWRVNVQSPISLPPYGEPQPDFALVQSRSYGGMLPRPEDVLMVIEVADTSLSYDQEIKLPLYAQAAIPEAWIVDTNAATVKRHSEPMSGIYTSTKTAGPDMEIESAVLAGLNLNVDSILNV